jgi:hypothetical protein
MTGSSAVATKPPLSVSAHFHEAVYTALLGIIGGGQHDAVLQAFRYAYEHRRGYPWLGEAKKDGLAYALSRALGSYTSATVDAGDNPGRPVDQPFRRQLEDAAQKAASYPLSLKLFAAALACDGIRADTLTVDELEGYLARAFRSYSAQPSAGTSLEPW